VPIKFRCTGCRSKLYVPSRSVGTSIVCPKCETRVVVTAATAPALPTSLEGPAVEQSLEELEPVGAEAFAAAPFELDLDPRRRAAPPRRGDRPSRSTAGGRSPRAAGPTVTLPAWVPYALAVAMVVVAVASFFLGAWWAKAGAVG